MTSSSPGDARGAPTPPTDPSDGPGATACPLCRTAVYGPPAMADQRTALDCPTCRLVFVEARHHLPEEEERRRYDLHENDPRDPDYRRFLSRLADPLLARVPPGSRGLDFGCGPGPALVRMLTEAGRPTVGWDPFYAADPAVLERRYDFLTATEVVEHLHDPAEAFHRMDELVRPGGHVGIMTALLTDDVELETWWYARDLTHVCFYRPATLDWLAGRLGWKLEYRTDRIAIFRTGFP